METLPEPRLPASLSWKCVILKKRPVPCLGAGWSLVVRGLHGTIALVSSQHTTSPGQALTRVPCVQLEVLGPFGVQHTPALIWGCTRRWVFLLLDLLDGLLFMQNI